MTTVRDSSLFQKSTSQQQFTRLCLVCQFEIAVERGHGRGAGMRAANIARGKMFQHYKTEHSALYAAMMADAQRRAEGRK